MDEQRGSSSLIHFYFCDVVLKIEFVLQQRMIQDRIFTGRNCGIIFLAGSGYRNSRSHLPLLRTS
jgi:hypothetical protein